MMIYLLKFIGCSGLLLLFYYGVLQNDRLFRFNRFFLLAIVAIAIFVPLTVVKTKVIEVPAAPIVQTFDKSISNESLSNALPLAEVARTPETSFSIPWESVIWGFYGLITALFLIRFFRNLRTLIRLKNKAHIVSDKGIKIVLREDIRASFSFLNLMYTNKTRFEQGNLPEEIIEHEKHHIKQKHSYDIIYIEFVQCLLWFNPFIYFIKKAIKLNHEFLADQHVLKRQSSAYEYQKILLDITRKQLTLTPVLASNLNYGFTKKRLNMMTKNTNKFKSMIKQVAAAGIIACTFWLGGETRLVAQEAKLEVEVNLNPKIDLDTKSELKADTRLDIDLNPTITLDRSLQDTIKKKKPVQQLLPQPPFKMVKVRFKDTNGNTVEKNFGELSEAQKERFMDKTSNPEFYLPPPPPSYVDDEMLEDFLNTEKYGVWIDEKRVENNKIKTLKPNDIHHFYKSRLYKNAIDYGKYTYQLNITTREHFKTMPSSNGSWLEYKPQPSREPLPPTEPEDKNEEIDEIAEVPELKEVPEVFEIVEVPKIKEIKEKPESVKEKSMVIKVKPKAALKENPKVKEIKLKEKNKTLKEKVKS